MVTKTQFEKELAQEILKVQNTMVERYGLRFEITIDWGLAKGFNFDDE